MLLFVISFAMDGSKSQSQRQASKLLVQVMYPSSRCFRRSQSGMQRLSSR